MLFVMGFDDESNKKVREAVDDKKFEKAPNVFKDEETASRIRIVVTGGKESGKSALITRFREKKFGALEGKIPSYRHEPNIKVAKTINFMVFDDKNIKLLIMYNHQGKLEASPTFDPGTSYDHTVVFLTWNIHRKGKPDEIQREILAERGLLQQRFPSAQFVLVITKIDKSRETDANSLKQIAEKNNFMGVAFTSALSGTNVDYLFKMTIHTCLAAKNQPLLVSREVAARVNYSGVLFASPPLVEASETAATVVLSGERQRERKALLPHLRAVYGEIKEEVEGRGGVNRDRKVVKLLAVHEILLLTELFPEAPMKQHVATVRTKYGTLGLEEGDSSKRVKNCLDLIDDYNPEQPKKAVFD